MFHFQHPLFLKAGRTDSHSGWQPSSPCAFQQCESSPCLTLAPSFISTDWIPLASSIKLSDSGQPALPGSLSGRSPEITKCQKNVLTLDGRVGGGVGRVGMVGGAGPRGWRPAIPVSQLSPLGQRTPLQSLSFLTCKVGMIVPTWKGSCKVKTVDNASC